MSHLFTGNDLGAFTADKALGLLETLTQVVAAVSVAKTDAEVNIASGSSIVAKGGLDVRATSLGSVSAAPLFQGLVGGKLGVPLPALGVGIVLTDAKVTIGGSVDVGGAMTAATKITNSVNVVSDASAVKGIAPSGALSYVDSDAITQITDDATLTVGGDLTVEAFTIDATGRWPAPTAARMAMSRCCRGLDELTSVPRQHRHGWQAAGERTQAGVEHPADHRPSFASGTSAGPPVGSIRRQRARRAQKTVPTRAACRRSARG